MYALYGGRKMKTLNEQIQNTTVGTDLISHRKFLETSKNYTTYTHIIYVTTLFPGLVKALQYKITGLI